MTRGSLSFSSSSLHLINPDPDEVYPLTWSFLRSLFLKLSMFVVSREIRWASEENPAAAKEDPGEHERNESTISMRAPV